MKNELYIFRIGSETSETAAGATPKESTSMPLSVAWDTQELDLVLRIFLAGSTTTASQRVVVGGK